MEEIDSAYNKNGVKTSINVLGYIRIDNRDIVIYKGKEDSKLLASYYTLNREDNTLELQPILDEAVWKKLEYEVSKLKIGE